MQPYDEFGLFHENAAEWGLAYAAAPVVRRETVDTGNGVTLSALVWGTSAPELVLLHGGGQNAHTWDTVALALGRPLVAIDLPGHGHSDPAWNTPAGATSGTSADATFGPHAYAPHVVSAIEQLAPSARCVTGMSLGGLTSIAVTALAPAARAPPRPGRRAALHPAQPRRARSPSSSTGPRASRRSTRSSNGR